MKQSDKEVKDIIDGVLIVGAGALSRELTKEIFNQHVIDSASVTSTEVVMSADGYAMIELNGEAEVVIPTSIMGLEDSALPYGGVIVRTEDQSPVSKLMKELSESYICKNIDTLEKQIVHDSQPWKKSNQRHPAFKKRK